jgi:hypothetical protein
MSLNHSIDRTENFQKYSSQQKNRVKYTRYPERYVANSYYEGSNLAGNSIIGDSPTEQPQQPYMYSEDMKQKIFFAKTAKNFYNLAKGYWRPSGKKSKKAKIETSM